MNYCKCQSCADCRPGPDLSPRDILCECGSGPFTINEYENHSDKYRFTATWKHWKKK